MCKGAVFASATQVEPADGIGVALILLAVHSNIHVDIAGFCASFSLLVSAASLETPTTSGLGFDTVEKRAALLATVLEGGVDGGGNETGHKLRHHARLLF